MPKRVLSDSELDVDSSKEDQNSESKLDSNEEESRPKRQRINVKSSKIVESDGGDDSEDSDDADWGDKCRKHKTLRSKRGRKVNSAKQDDKSDDEHCIEEGEVSAQSSESSDDDRASDADEFGDGLDANLLGDEEDQMKLQQMSEKDREEEIFKRLERREMLKTRRDIEKKLRLKAKKKQQKPSGGYGSDNVQSDDSAKRRKYQKSDLKKKNIAGGRSTEGIYDDEQDDQQSGNENPDELLAQIKTSTEKAKDASKRDAMKSLVAKREEKRRLAEDSKKKVLKVEEVFKSSSSSSSSNENRSDSESEEASDDSDSEDEDGVRKKLERSRPIVTKGELERIRLPRVKLEKIVFAPFFAKAVTGCFVRISIGQNLDHKPVYRIAEVVDVVETAKVYAVGSSRTNKGLKLRHGKQERVYRLEFVSNHGIDDKEFIRWKEAMAQADLPLPTEEFVKRKALEIRTALNHSYNEAEIEEMVKEKMRFRKTVNNYAIQKSQLLKLKEVAMQSNDDVELSRIVQELEELEQQSADAERKRTAAILPIGYINQRNRQKNMQEVEEALKQQVKLIDDCSDDLFARRKGQTKIQATVTRTVITPIQKPAGLINNCDNTFTTITNNNNSSSSNGELGMIKSKTAVSSPVKKSVHHSSAHNHAHSKTNDLFSAHNFDINIELKVVPNISTMTPVQKTTESKSSSLSGPRTVNLEDYKRRKGLL